MNEEQAAAKFIFDTLSAADAVTDLVDDRIYEGFADQGESYPLILFNLQSPGNDRTVPGGDQRMMSRGLWLVKATVEGSSYADADAIASAIDAALLGATGVVTIGDQDYIVLSLVRERGHRMPEMTDGVQYRHSGGLYRVQCTSRS